MVAYYPNAVRLLMAGTKGGTMTGSRLTDVDRRIMAKADEVAALKSTEAMSERYGKTEYEMARGETGGDMARAAALAEAQFLLLEQNAIIRRLEADASRLRNDRARYRIQLKLRADDDDREALREAAEPGRLDSSDEGSGE